MDQVISMLTTLTQDPEMVTWGIYLVASLAGVTFAISISYLVFSIGIIFSD